MGKPVIQEEPKGDRRVSRKLALGQNQYAVQYINDRNRKMYFCNAPEG